MKKKDNVYLILTIGIFVITLLPLIVVSFYNHMYCDDYEYTQSAMAIASADGMLFPKLGQLLVNAISSTQEMWYTWSGCYTSYFFCALSPCVFGDKYVPLNIFILLGSFIVANLLAFRLIVIETLKLTSKKAWVVCLSSLFISIQFVPSTAEAYYWYNGAFYNIVGYSMGILLFAILIKLVMNRDKVRLSLYFVSGFLLAFFFAGTNYSSILLYMVLYFFMIIYIVVKRKVIEKRRWMSSILIIACFYGGCILSLIAPGNTLRQVQVNQLINERVPAVKAVVLSIVNVGSFIKENTSILMILVVILTLPFVFSCAKEIDIEYKYPAFVVMLSYILMAVTFTPTMYAINSLGPWRTHNVYFFFYVLFLYFNLFYVSGWLSKHIKFERINWYSFEIYSQLAVLCGLIALIFVPIEEYKDIAFVSAASSYLSGEVQEYDRQISERMNILNDPDIKDVVFTNLTENPDILAVDINEGLTDDPDWFVNQIVKNYFGKDSVISVDE